MASCSHTLLQAPVQSVTFYVQFIPWAGPFFLCKISIQYERGFPYHLFWPNQRNADIKIYSRTGKDSERTDVLAHFGGNEEIISHNLNRTINRNINLRNKYVTKLLANCNLSFYSPLVQLYCRVANLKSCCQSHIISWNIQKINTQADRKY